MARTDRAMGMGSLVWERYNFPDRAQRASTNPVRRGPERFARGGKVETLWLLALQSRFTRPNVPLYRDLLYPCRRKNPAVTTALSTTTATRSTRGGRWRAK